MEVQQFENLQYVIRYPRGFDQSKQYPVILELHGAGTRSCPISEIVSGLFFKTIERYDDFPFVCVAPHCVENTWFDIWEQLKKLVCHITSQPNVDRDRVYIMGASMGGYATWQLAMSMPEYFAAIVPICGGGMYWNAGRLKDTPVWAFHGAQDTTVLPEESKKMVDSVNAAGGCAKLTLYPENGHDAWSDTYANAEVFSWLLTHKNKHLRELTDQYTNPKEFG